MQYLTSEATREFDLPFSEAVRVGNMLYLSGEIGTDYTTNSLVEGGISAETKQTMENIKSTLEKNGSSLDKVVKCTVMMADIKKWGEMNKVAGLRIGFGIAKPELVKHLQKRLSGTLNITCQLSR